MALLQSCGMSASGMTAQQFRADIIAENLANVNTTRTDAGTTYRRKVVAFQEKGANRFDRYLTESRKRGSHIGNGVKVVEVREDMETDFIMEYDPSHPDADENGYVSYPNVNLVTEMTNLIDASRAYEANITAFDASKAMAQAGLQIGK